MVTRTGLPEELEEALIDYLMAPDEQQPALLSAMLERWPEHRLDVLAAVSDEDPTELSPLPAKGEQFGDFEIVRKIGSGGMGVVYEAVDRTLGRRVALKLLPEAGNTAQVSRFCREAEAASQLEHPNIVRVYRIGEAQGRQYLAMEFVEGRMLAAAIREMRQRCAERRPTPLDLESALRCELPAGLRSSRYEAAVAALLAPIAHALHLVHEQGIRHRDVKPSNIMVRADGSPVLLDFGLAALEGYEQLSLSGEFVGTIRYASPEQASRRTVDERTDVYSLGVTLYELLTLEPAFEGSWDQLMHRVRMGPVPSPRSVAPSLRLDVDHVCTKSLAKEPQHRYQSAEAFAKDLDRVAEDRPVEARALSPWTKAYRWSRLHPGVVAFASVAVLLLLAGAYAWSLVGLVAEEKFLRARSALLTGQYEQALAGADSAEAYGYSDRVELALLRVEVWDGQGRFDAARDLLRSELLDVADTHPRWALITLWRADRLVDRYREPRSGLDRVEAALAHGQLGAANRAYARGILASTYAEARRFLERAVALDTRHRRARLCLAALEVLSAHLPIAELRVREAETAFPGDPTVRALRHLLAVRKGERAPLDPREAREEIELETLVGFLLRSTRDIFVGWSEIMMASGDAQKVLKLMAFVGRGMASIKPLFGLLGSGRPITNEAGLSLHPLVVEVWRPLLQKGPGSLLSIRPSDSIRAIVDESIAKSGDATLHMVRGVMLGRAGGVAALRDFDAAATHSSPADIRRYALRFAVMVPNDDEKKTKLRVRELVQQLDVEPIDFEVAYEAVRGRPMASEVLARWRVEFPEDQTARRLEVQRAFAQGDLDRAERLCKEAIFVSQRIWQTQALKRIEERRR